MFSNYRCGRWMGNRELEWHYVDDQSDEVTHAKKWFGYVLLQNKVYLLKASDLNSKYTPLFAYFVLQL